MLVNITEQPDQNTSSLFCPTVHHSLSELTFLYVIAPTTAGPMNPGKVAIVLVIPISVPTH